MDFLSGTLPESEPAVTSISAGAPSGAAMSAAAGQVSTAGGSGTEPLAFVTISADRAHHGRMDVDSVLTFPDPAPDPVIVPLYTATVQVGRAKPARGVYPDIDLAASPHEDPAASTRHAVIEQRGDGGWWITDLDSTNGTFLGEAANQLVANTPTPLTPGTAVFVGAWTRLVLTDPPPEAA